MGERPAAARLGRGTNPRPAGRGPHSRHRRPCTRSAPWLAIARLAAVAALLAAVAACDLGTPQPVQQKAQAAPAAAPPVAPAAKPPSTTESAPPGSLPPTHDVTQRQVDELRRKRAEWEELQRMQEQGRSQVEAWQRSRRPTDGGPAVPRVGDAQRTVSQSEIDRMAPAMHAWYRHYSGRSAAVTRALSQYGSASTAEPLDPSLLRAACGDLLAASTALLADRRALPAPLGNVSNALSTAYTEIKATAESCLAYREEDRAAHLAAALRAMAEAGAALRPYEMTP